MMDAPEERVSNRSLLNVSGCSNQKTNSIYSIVDAIAVDRPLANLDEARGVAYDLNNILAFVEYGAANKTGYPGDFARIESIMEGLGQIMECCRLASLRVEQFLDLQEDAIGNTTKEPSSYLQEYRKIKSDHKNRILLFQMGDFYEMFWDDAEIASVILKLTLTSRNKKDEENIPMCGFPVHAAHTYIAKLVKAGQRVAVCDQVQTDKGLLEHEVVRLVTP